MAEFDAQQRIYDDRRLSSLRTERQPFEVLWKDLRDFFSPRSGAFENETRRGERTDQQIINETAIFARRTLAQGMSSGITPRSRPWLRLLPPDPEMAEFGPVKTWLHEVQQRMQTVFLKSNLYGNLYKLYDRMGTFGTGCIGIYEDFDTVIRAVHYDIGSYYLTADANGRVNGFWREYKVTVEQMVAEFGLENVPPEVKAAYDAKSLDGKYTVVHLIEKNQNMVLGRKDARNKPWRSVYYCQSDKSKNLRESGFDMFPIIGGRWDIFQMGPYGNSPAMDVIGSVKQLQVQELNKGEAIEKMVNPALQAPSRLQGEVIDALPGGITYYDEVQGAAGVRSLYDVRLDINALAVDMDRVEQRINRGMFADLFLMISGDDRNQRATAYEIAERKEEKLLALGPVLEGVDNDVLNPLVDRTFGIMWKNGLIPPPPQELQDQDLKVEYISVLHQAQKAVSTASIERTAAFIGNIAAVNPDILDKWDADQSVDEFADAVGAPPRMIRSDDDVAAIRAQKAQQQQAAQAAAMAQQAAMGAKTLADTKVGDQGSALDMLLGTMPAA